MPTFDRLLHWKVVVVDTCLLCGLSGESVEHMFFECSVSSHLWQNVLNLLRFGRPAARFTNELSWMIKSSKRGGGRHKLLIMLFAEIIYSMWLNRNDKLFNNHCKTSDVLFRETMFKVAARAPTELSNLLIELSC